MDSENKIVVLVNSKAIFGEFIGYHSNRGANSLSTVSTIFGG